MSGTKTRIAINGFGRIGRLALRSVLSRDDLEIVAVNDLADNASLAYLFKHDSVHGKYPASVRYEEGTELESTLVVGDQRIPFTSFRDPKDAKWGERGVDIVLECTGVFTQRDKAAVHLDSGAKRVLISAPGKAGVDGTFCLGVNEHEFDPERHKVVSNASCTTNCVAPPLKALHDAFTITHGTLNTVHAYTMGQGLLDSPNKKDFRRGRAAAVNLTPTSTGAARAVGEVIPDLKGKLDGLAIRTPHPDGSLSDLTLLFETEPSIDQVHEVLRAFAAKHPTILEVSEDELVSSDIVGNTHSSIVDTKMTMKVGPLIKILAWYDNEGGYATRLVDMAAYIGSQGR